MYPYLERYGYSVSRMRTIYRQMVFAVREMISMELIFNERAKIAVIHYLREIKPLIRNNNILRRYMNQILTIIRPLFNRETFRDMHYYAFMKYFDRRFGGIELVLTSKIKRLINAMQDSDIEDKERIIDIIRNKFGLYVFRIVATVGGIGGLNPYPVPANPHAWMYSFSEYIQKSEIDAMLNFREEETEGSNEEEPYQIMEYRITLEDTHDMALEYRNRHGYEDFPIADDDLRRYEIMMNDLLYFDENHSIV